MIKAAILGASGYTGAELVRILSQHPEFKVSMLSGDSKSGLNYGEVYPSLNHLKMPKLVPIEEIDFDGQDIIFCALPHKKSANIIKYIPNNIKVIDLSADFRLRDVKQYEKWYGDPHPASNLRSCSCSLNRSLKSPYNF